LQVGGSKKLLRERFSGPGAFERAKKFVEGSRERAQSYLKDVAEYQQKAFGVSSFWQGARSWSDYVFGISRGGLIGDTALSLWNNTFGKLYGGFGSVDDLVTYAKKEYEAALEYSNLSSHWAAENLSSLMGGEEGLELSSIEAALRTMGGYVAYSAVPPTLSWAAKGLATTASKALQVSAGKAATLAAGAARAANVVALVPFLISMGVPVFSYISNKYFTDTEGLTLRNTVLHLSSWPIARSAVFSSVEEASQLAKLHQDLTKKYGNSSPFTVAKQYNAALSAMRANPNDQRLKEQVSTTFRDLEQAINTVAAISLGTTPQGIIKLNELKSKNKEAGRLLEAYTKLREKMYDEVLKATSSADPYGLVKMEATDVYAVTMSCPLLAHGFVGSSWDKALADRINAEYKKTQEIDKQWLSRIVGQKKADELVNQLYKPENRIMALSVHTNLAEAEAATTSMLLEYADALEKHPEAVDAAIRDMESSGQQSAEKVRKTMQDIRRTMYYAVTGRDIYDPLVDVQPNKKEAWNKSVESLPAMVTYLLACMIYHNRRQALISQGKKPTIQGMKQAILEHSKTVGQQVKSSLNIAEANPNELPASMAGVLSQFIGSKYLYNTVSELSKTTITALKGAKTIAAGGNAVKTAKILGALSKTADALRIPRWLRKSSPIILMMAIVMNEGHIYSLLPEKLRSWLTLQIGGNSLLDTLAPKKEKAK